MATDPHDFVMAPDPDNTEDTYRAMRQLAAAERALAADHPCRTSHDPRFTRQDMWGREDVYECRLCGAEIRRPWERVAAPMRAYDAHDSEDYLRADGEAEQREGRWR